MRKRLIGKAFAIAMSGAMVLTATPVTANIFHVAHIVKAADEQSDEYVYCYAGLTWNEYWASEGIYAAGNDSSSDTLDSHSELDNGGYDAVTRATTNHGLHRGSFQCITTIYTTDGSAYQISNWEQVKDSDGKVTATYLHLKDVEGRVTFNKGTLTFADNSTKKMDHYSVSGIKYVPVKVKTSDYEAFKEVLTELRPQLVIVWNKAIKDCLLSNGDLQFVGMINIPIISTYMFIYEGAEPELSPKQLEKLKKEYNIISEKIETKWLRELLIESFNDPHAVEAFRQKIEYVKCIQGGRSDSNIDNIVTLLKRCATQKLIIRMGNKLNFGPGLSRVHKEIFLKLIKESFDAPLKGTNEAFSKMFDYKFGHCKIPDNANDNKIKLMKSIFSMVKKKKIEERREKDEEKLVSHN